jgi:hypothetical protein
MTADNKTLIDLYKIIVTQAINMMLATAKDDAQRELQKSLMAETLALAASLHHDTGGSGASFIVMATDTIAFTESDGATKQ